MLLLGEEMAPFTLLLLSVGHSGRLVEARPEGFPHQLGGGSMVAAFTAGIFFKGLRPSYARMHFINTLLEADLR